MSPDRYADALKVKSELQKKAFTEAIFGNMFSEVYDCTPENFQSFFHEKLILPRSPRINESISIGKLELEHRIADDILVYVANGKIIQSFPIESDVEYEHWKINTDKPSIYLYDNEEHFGIPWKKNKKLPFPVTRQIEVSYTGKVASDVCVRRIVYKDSGGDGKDLDPFFLLSISNYANEGNSLNSSKWIEESRSYYRPGEEYWDWEAVYYRNRFNNSLEFATCSYHNSNNLAMQIDNVGILAASKVERLLDWDSLEPIE